MGTETIIAIIPIGNEKHWDKTGLISVLPQGIKTSDEYEGL